jgi:hypothetical protein
VVYSRRHYEPIIVYERWHYRDNPRWHENQITLVFERNAGRAPVPPRVVNVTNVTNVNVMNVTNVTNVNTFIGPTRTVVATRGEKAVQLDTATRTQVRTTTQTAQQTFVAERRRTETTSTGPLTKPRVTALKVNPTPPVPARLGTSSGPPLQGNLAKPNPGLNPTLGKQGTSDPGKGAGQPPAKGAPPIIGTHPPKGNPVITRPNPKKAPDDHKKKG